MSDLRARNKELELEVDRLTHELSCFCSKYEQLKVLTEDMKEAFQARVEEYRVPCKGCRKRKRR